VVISASGLPAGYRNNNGTFNNIGNNGIWWSSSENNTTNAWNRNLNYNNGNANRNNNNKKNGFSVRCLRDSIGNNPRFSGVLFLNIMQLELFSINEEISLTEEFFMAYYACRKNKRNTLNALRFEKHFEHNLFVLIEQIKTNSYYPGKSIAFIVNKPVTREIFAADFRDRVVHHWLIAKLNPLFEKHFIFDSYACRIGKGTHFGIKRLDAFIKSCSKNYTTDCYVLKLDIQGFFMHINRTILYDKLTDFIERYYMEQDKSLVLDLCQKIIFNDPTKNCIIKGNKNNWNDLPRNKSLFYSPKDCGLPIGNLTSQVFANFYMNTFDHFIKKELDIKYYGRYVDDFIIVHNDKDYLKSLLPTIGQFLQSQLQLSLHPKKIYLQHFSKGVQFLGTLIKPNRIYIANRTKGNFYSAIQKQNAVVQNKKPTRAEQHQFLSSMNSYLGIMKHYKTYRLRKKMLFKNLSGWWWNQAYLSGGIAKFVLKRKVEKRKNSDILH
jgi:RNA-directed DNA polymerase